MWCVLEYYQWIDVNTQRVGLQDGSYRKVGHLQTRPRRSLAETV